MHETGLTMQSSTQEGHVTCCCHVTDPSITDAKQAGTVCTLHMCGLQELAGCHVSLHIGRRRELV